MYLYKSFYQSKRTDRRRVKKWAVTAFLYSCRNRGYLAVTADWVTVIDVLNLNFMICLSNIWYTKSDFE